MESTTYLVGGMSCGGCVASVTKALTRALGDGVILDVTLERGEVRVGGEHDPAAVATAIDKAGFSFDGPVEG